MAESILKLKVDSQEYDGKIKRAAAGIQHLDSDLRKAGKTFADCDKEQVEFIRQLGNMETVSKTAKGKLGELSAAFTDLKIKYNAMSDAEKKSDAGRALSSSLEQIKNKANATRQELQGITNELNNGSLGKNGGMSAGLSNLNGLLGQIGSQLGINTSMLSTFSAGSLTASTSVGAVATAIGLATKALVDYNSELAKQQQITTVTTGLKGDDADQLTSAARAMSKVYGADFREVINAANVLINQFGKSGDEAIQLLRDGMQGMIQGDGPKLLSMIQQYAPAFHDAGVEASQLIAIIQNSEGGIFTDQNMTAIVMGIKNIRLMTKSTADALADVGINGEEMTRKLSDGSMTIFDALRQVSEALAQTNAGSQEAGQVMQQVFGRQGTMAGSTLAKAIASLNTNLDETKGQTGEVGESLAALNRTMEAFEKKLNDVFDMDGWDVMTNDIKNGLLVSLNDTLTSLGDIFRMLNGIANTNMNASGVATFFMDLLTYVNYVANPLYTIFVILGKINKMFGGGGGGSDKLSPEMEKVYRLADEKGFEELYGEVVVTPDKPVKTKTTRRGGGGGNKIQKTEEQLNNEQIAKLTSEFEKASEDRRKAIQEEIKALQDRNFEIKTYQDLATGKVKARSPLAQGEGMMSLTGGFMNDVAKSLINPDKISPDAIVTPLEQMNQELQRLIELRDQAFTSEGWQLGNQLVTQQQQKIAKYKGEDKDKDKKEEKSVSQGVSQLAGSMSQMVNGIEQLGIDVPEDIKGVISGIQGVATILTTIAAVVNAIEVIVGATSFIPGFANGGIVPHAANGFVVPGTHFSGDVTPIMANAGEVVLSRSQVNNVASALEGGGGMQRIIVEGVISGDNLRLVQKRNNLRWGFGEYVTTKKV